LRDPLFGVGPSSTTLTNPIQQQTLFNVNNLKQNRTEKQCYLQINTEREREDLKVKWVRWSERSGGAGGGVLRIGGRRRRGWCRR